MKALRSRSRPSLTGAARSPRTRTNITANLPNASGEPLAMVNGRPVLATDVRLFVASEKATKHWTRVSGLPNAVIDDVRALPLQNAVVAAAHGRGVWTVNLG